MRLSFLFPHALLSADPDILFLCEDTRRAGPGALFFAHVGSKQDGIKFLDEAIMRGCVACIVPNDAILPNNFPSAVPVIRVENTRREIARCAHLFYPRTPDHIIAVTGTSGKTSTTYFVQQILNMCGNKAVSIGTIGVAGAVTETGKLTTPEAPDLHNMLNDFASRRITHVALEASSQALDQHRLDYVRIDAAAFINLSHDHLDYHRSTENYMAAKKRLFGQILADTGTAVLNADDDVFDEFHASCLARAIKTISFGKNGHDIKLTSHAPLHGGQKMTLLIDGQTYHITTSVVGIFQCENIMAAIGLTQALGIPLHDILRAVGHMVAPPGRMQHVPCHPNGAHIYVDYAHKPDALENVLKSIRTHTPGKLIVVFGCGGDRDPSKRPIMGEIASRLADVTIITDDNPRSENPDLIRAQIATACSNAQVIANRRLAIQTAIAQAKTGDSVIIAGKGHEQGQIFANHTDPFDDVAECRTAISLISSPLPSSLQGLRS